MTGTILPQNGGNRQSNAQKIHDIFDDDLSSPSAVASSPLPGESHPAVKRSRSFVKCPILIIAEVIRKGVLKNGDTEIILAFADACSLLPSRQRSLSFRSQESVAKQLNLSTRTIKRAVKRFRKADLAIVYAARMAEGRADGGQYARNVYDFSPMFLLCGEEVVPHSMQSALKHLNAEGRWVRGLQRQDADGNVTAKIVAADVHVGTGESPGRNSEPHREDMDTGGHQSHTNHTPHRIDIVNKTKYNQPPARLRSVGDDLDGECQVVFATLKELGYGPYKAAADLRKYGAAYVQRCIDCVKGMPGVESIYRMINCTMGKDLDELYRANSKAKPAPKHTANVEKPDDFAPARATAQSQDIKPKLSVTEQTAILQEKILAQPEARIARACSQARKNIPAMRMKFDPTLNNLTWEQLVRQMSWTALVETDVQIAKLLHGEQT